MGALDACIHAKRPLQCGVADIFASDFDTALAEAEQARDALIARLSNVIDLLEERPSDRALRLMAMALKALLSTECNGDRVFLAIMLMQKAPLLEVQGLHPRCRRYAACSSASFAAAPF